jgi:putative heme-binding domain-containing protein
MAVYPADIGPRWRCGFYYYRTRRNKSFRMHPTTHYVRVVASLLLSGLFFVGCSNQNNNVDPAIGDSDAGAVVYGPYRVIKLPVTNGVNILNPIQLQLGPHGVLFAANQSGEVYTLVDSDNDGLEDQARLYCNVSDYGLRSPAGFAYRGDTIFIGTAQEIRAFRDTDNDGKADTSWTFFKEIPYSEHPYEWTCAMNFDKDGWLYFVLSTDSWNAGASPDPKKYRGSLLKIAPDGKSVVTVATGLRSVYATQFNSQGDLFFIDNEGGGNATEELNIAVDGGFYGHNPQKYNGHDSTISPALSLTTEVAPSGLVFNRGNNDFGGTGGDLFVSFYGPGERWKRGGVARIKMERQSNGKYTFEETALADIPKLSALTFGKDGSLYLAHHGLSDYWYNSTEEKTGGFYKIVYDPSLKSSAMKKRAAKANDLSPNSVEAGKQLFGRRACSACHSVDGKTELLGPDLKGLGTKLSREDILLEIEKPSEIIKPSMAGMRVFTKDGQTLLGRVVNANDEKISLMLIGNKVIEIPRNNVLRTENEKKSLMYEGLINGMSKEEIRNLLDYLGTL